MTIIKYRSLLVVLVTFIVPLTIFAQKKKKLPISDTATKAVPVVIVPSPKPGAPRPFSEIIPDTALVCKGAINIYKTADKWFFELPDSLLGRDMLIVSRIIKGAADTRFVSEGYAGDQINEGIIRFEKGINGKLFIRSISYSVMSKDSSRPMFQSVMNSNVQPIAATFDIKALSKDSTGV
ncbi:MAG: DUF5117 domain-containing protein, partial [Chitinophagaceae bacterium]|nr:DUF5117 domain-containing protein [Chitinophagaceae bacterium]